VQTVVQTGILRIVPSSRRFSLTVSPTGVIDVITRYTKRGRKRRKEHRTMKCTTLLMTIGFGLVWSPCGPPLRNRSRLPSRCARKTSASTTCAGSCPAEPWISASAIEGILVNNTNETLTHSACNSTWRPVHHGRNRGRSFHPATLSRQQWRFIAYIEQRLPAMDRKTEAARCTPTNSPGDALDYASLTSILC